MSELDRTDINGTSLDQQGRQQDEAVQALQMEDQTMIAEQQQFTGDDETVVVDLSGFSTVEEPEDLSKYQRIRDGFFAQTREPALTINGKTVSVNAAAVRLMPDVDYMEILINLEDKKVVFAPSEELNIYGYKWAREKDGRRYSTQRTGIPFVLCACQIMGWNPTSRIRIRGKKVPSSIGEEVLVFDLKLGQEFEKPETGEGGKKNRSTILTGWNGTFGPAYDGKSGVLRVDTFDGYNVMVIGKQKKGTEQSRDNALMGVAAQQEKLPDRPQTEA